MKKFVYYLPHILFAVALIGLGAFGKLTGNPMAVSMFETINLYNINPDVTRIIVGLAQLFAGVGVFFTSTRKVAAIMGTAIMAAAINYTITLFGGPIFIPLIVMLLGIWILFKGECTSCCKKCGGEGTCKC